MPKNTGSGHRIGVFKGHKEYRWKMEPIRTSKTTGIYGAPKGLEDTVGGLPYYREENDGFPMVYSVWTLTDAERAIIANGGNIVLGIMGEPIPPVSLNVEVDDR